MHSENDSNAVSIISNLPEKLLNDPSNISKTEIISYMRENGDDRRNYYKNLTNASVFLRKSGQLATIIPLKVNFQHLFFLIGVFDCLGLTKYIIYFFIGW